MLASHLIFMKIIIKRIENKKFRGLAFPLLYFEVKKRISLSHAAYLLTIVKQFDREQMLKQQRKHRGTPDDDVKREICFKTETKYLSQSSSHFHSTIKL
jgi:hypothetical protein